MSLPGPVMLALYLAVLIALAFPLAIFMARIADARPMRGPVGAFERLLYRAAAVDPAHDMPWTQYAVAVLLFNALGALVVYALQRLQVWLPLNPQGFANVSAGLLLQHRRELRHQHQLAGLLRRVDDELS